MFQKFDTNGQGRSGMDCYEQYTANILLYLRNELNGEARESLLSHLSHCSECRNRLEEERGLTDILLRARPLVLGPESLRERIIAQYAFPVSSPRFSGKSGREKPFRRTVHLWSRPFWSIPGFAAAAIVLVIIGIASTLAIVHHEHSQEYVSTAVLAHQRYLRGQLPLEIRTDSPEALTSWLKSEVSSNAKLPDRQKDPAIPPIFQLKGASVVRYADKPAALIAYEMPAEKISLLVASSDTVSASGGYEVHSKSLTFHRHTAQGLNVVTWSNHGITYALVSSEPASSRHSCLICHQNMADRREFR